MTGINTVAAGAPMIGPSPLERTDMHPVLVELLARPVGWLLIAGTLVMLGIGIGVPLFIRARERSEAEQARGGGRPDRGS